MQEMKVALFAEGVDRNYIICSDKRKLQWSPSSRRAWIEISLRGGAGMGCTSPSSRRAWIEIRNFALLGFCLDVALLAEGVDRNLIRNGIVTINDRRPPRGGRG